MILRKPEDDRKRQTTVVCSIAISDVEKTKENILSSSFNTTEKEELAGRHIRSTAGWLVLKKALCRLLEQLDMARLSEIDVSLKRTDAGRPYIADINIQAMDKASLTRNLFVSISHNRTTAYGMAVYQEEGHEN